MPRILQIKTSRKSEINSRPGFTLIELILIMLIASLLMLLVLPSISRLTPSERKKSTLRRLTSLMAWTQNRAVIDGRQYVIVCDFEKQEFRMREREIPSEEEEEEYVISRIELGDEMRLADVMTPSDTFDSRYFIVSHYPNGMVDPYIVHLEFEEDGEISKISVKVNPLTGEATIYDEYRTWDDELKR